MTNTNQPSVQNALTNNVGYVKLGIVKHSLDMILEPLLAAAIPVYAAMEAVNWPIETYLNSDPKSLLYSSAVTVGAIGLAYLEAKKRPVTGFIHKRIKDNVKKLRTHVKPTKSGIAKTALLGSLAALISFPPSIMSKYSTNRLPLNIPGVYSAIKSNLSEAINPSDEDETNVSDSDLETMLNKQTPATFDNNTMVHAQTLRMSSLQKAKKEMGEAVFRYNHYRKEVEAAYNNQGLKDLGITYSLFIGLLAHESKFNPEAISKTGAVGIGQLMPGAAWELKRKVWTYKGYDKDSKSLYDYAERLRKFRAKTSLTEMQKLDARFNPQQNIDMSAAHLAKLRKNHLDEDVLITLTRYNTLGGAIEWSKNKALETLNLSKEEKSKLTIWQIAPYLQQEGEKYALNIIAAGKIMEKPAEYGVVSLKPSR